MHDPNEWTLITVTYNSDEQLLSNWARADFGGARWLVVDNASSDRSVDTARELGAEVLALSANVGFGAANNLGLAAVKTRWTMFVNPDVIVDAADLNRLSLVSHANRGALVAPQLLNSNGTEQANARGLPFLVDKIAHRTVRRRSTHTTQYTRVGLAGPTFAAWAMGAAVGGPTAAFQSLDGWDERYFIYYEDHDLGLRAWNSGGAVVIDPSVRWAHQWQRATLGLAFAPWRHELRSMRIFYRSYPQLLSKSRFSNSGQFAELRARLWQPASSPTSGLDADG